MACRYSVAEARAQLPSILVQAEAGEAIELTRRGQPVAVVLSHEAFERLRYPRPSFGEAYRSLDLVGADEEGARRRPKCHDLILVTANVKDFRRFDGLRIEGWRSGSKFEEVVELERRSLSHGPSSNKLLHCVVHPARALLHRLNAKFSGRA